MLADGDDFDEPIALVIPPLQTHFPVSFRGGQTVVEIGPQRRLLLPISHSLSSLPTVSVSSASENDDDQVIEELVSSLVYYTAMRESTRVNANLLDELASFQTECFETAIQKELERRKGGGGGSGSSDDHGPARALAAAHSVVPSAAAASSVKDKRKKRIPSASGASGSGSGPGSGAGQSVVSSSSNSGGVTAGSEGKRSKSPAVSKRSVSTSRKKTSPPITVPISGSGLGSPTSSFSAAHSSGSFLKGPSMDDLSVVAASPRSSSVIASTGSYGSAADMEASQAQAASLSMNSGSGSSGPLGSLNNTVATPGFASPYPSQGVAAVLSATTTTPASGSGLMNVDPVLEAICKRLAELSGFVQETVKAEKIKDKKSGRMADD
eukprot:ANDGO_00560.mRNA.1 hypothetical protein